MNDIKIGFKIWSGNEHLFSKINELHSEGVISFVEVYIVPGSYKSAIGKIKKLNLPIVIHAPHTEHNFNITDENLFEPNIKMFNETKKIADEADAKHIIIHAGVGGSIESAEKFLQKLGDKRVIIENMPKRGLKNENCLGYSKEQIKELMDCGCGFCLDFSHACKAAVSLKTDYKELIKELVKLKPVMFHISDGNLDNEFDEHLAFGKGNFDIKFFLDCVKNNKDKLVTLETFRKDNKSFDEDIKNLEYLNKL